MTAIYVPELDGMALTVIAHKKHPALLIVISAYPNEQRLALAAGSALFLAETIGYARLIAAVNALLGNTTSNCRRQTDGELTPRHSGRDIACK